MMPRPDTDYRHYNLEQLYEILRQTDNEQYPERVIAVRRAIALKENSNPKTYFDSPCLLLIVLGAKNRRLNHGPTKALKIARIVVNLEFWAIVLLMVWLISIEFSLVPAMSVVIIVLYFMYSCGMVLLNKWLNSVRNLSSVELWSLIAVGVAPFSAVLYAIVAAFILDQFDYPSLSLILQIILAPLAGFYTPFVLATLWVKYHCREDEF